MQRYRAESLSQPSNLSQAMRDTLDGSSYLFGSIMTIPHTTVARTLAALGLDFVMIDPLHSAIDPPTLVQLIQTINFCSEGKTVAVVRVPSARSSLLTHALDAGAAGIVFPHINTPEQAAEAVSKCRYPYSGGTRPRAPAALIAGIMDSAPPGLSQEKVADRHIAVICEIESKVAVDNLDAIASTPGLDALMLGPSDLRVSLGLPAQKSIGQCDQPEFMAAVDALIRAAEKYQKPLCIVSFRCTAQSDPWISKFQILLISTDVSNIVKGQQRDLAKAKDLLEKLTRPGDDQSKHAERKAG